MRAPTKAPGPRLALPAYASLYRDPLGYLVRAAGKYGDITLLQIDKRNDYLLNHPDYIRAILLDQEGTRRSVHRPLQRILGQGLLTSRDKIHRKQRALLQPVFHRQLIASLGKVMAHEIERWSDRWQDGAMIEMADEMTRLTMSIAGKTLFNVDLEFEATELRDALVTVLTATRFNNLLLVSKALEKLPLPSNLRFRRAAKRLDSFIHQMIRERHRGACNEPDLLSVLVRLSKEKPRMMNDQKIRDQILTFFVGGHETIATALMWTWYLLAKNTEAAEKLHAELDAVLQGRLPTVDDLEKLIYARKVFNESMRVFPPVWIMGRRVLRDIQLDGYTIPKDSYVHVSQFLMHRDARYFPDPMRFDPDRWTAEVAATRPRFCYFPFGGGSLQCIGEGFAFTQALLMIGIIASRWRMRIKPGHKIELEPQLTLRSRYGMPMILEQRK